MCVEGNAYKLICLTRRGQYPSETSGVVQLRKKEQRSRSQFLFPGEALYSISHQFPLIPAPQHSSLMPLHFPGTTECTNSSSWTSAIFTSYVPAPQPHPSIPHNASGFIFLKHCSDITYLLPHAVDQSPKSLL